MRLMHSIRDFAVPKGAVAIWWLGQNGFIFKSPEGTTAGVDLYLTDSCATLLPGFDSRRQVPVLIEPEELDIDLFACTHNHQDHTDPETIRRLRNREARFLGPHPSCDVFAREGVETGRITPAWPQCEVEFKDIHIRGTFALPTDHTDLNHMGFLLSFGKAGPRVYITGDTDYTELLAEAGSHNPGLMITCINGGFNNLSHWEAAEVASRIKPKVAIPCHYDMFPDNAVDPRMFRASLSLRAPDVRYQALEHGKPLVFEAT